MIDLEELTRQAGELEPLPAVVSRLAALISRDRPDPERIIDVVSDDSELSASLLRYVNSVSRPGRRQTTTCRAAVERIGIGPVLAVAVASSVRRRMDVALPQFGLADGELWRHSVAAALVVEELSAATDVYVPPESAAAALLHDVGKPLLASRIGPKTLVDEARLLGTSHGELGGVIARHWDLPQNIVQGIRHHHQPTQGTSPICDVVHVANEVARMVPGARMAGAAHRSGSWEGLQRPAMKRLGLSLELLAGITNVAAARFDPMLAHYSTA